MHALPAVVQLRCFQAVSPIWVDLAMQNIVHVVQVFQDDTTTFVVQVQENYQLS
jgi:hypothetical protein